MARALLALAISHAALALPAPAAMESGPAAVESGPAAVEPGLVAAPARTRAAIEKCRRKNRNRREAAARQRQALTQDAAARRWVQEHPPVPPPAPAAPAKAIAAPAQRPASPGRLSRFLMVLGTMAACLNSAMAQETATAAALLPEPPSSTWDEVVTLHPLALSDRAAASAPGEAEPSRVPDPPSKPYIVLALYNPATGNDEHFLEYEIARSGVETVEILGEGPDLSAIAPDGELLISAHGVTGGGSFGDGDRTIPIESVLAALTDGQRGLPKDFHGTINIVACNAGLDRSVPVPPALLDGTEAWLRHSGVTDANVRWIMARISASRTISRSLELRIRARLRKDAARHPAPGRLPVDRVMAVLMDNVGKALRTLSPGSLVGQIADGLSAAGYEGIEVYGPVSEASPIHNDDGALLEVLNPGTDLARYRKLTADLARFHHGDLRGPARDRLLSMGVDPRREGAARHTQPGCWVQRPALEPQGRGLVREAERRIRCDRFDNHFIREFLLNHDLTEALGQPRVFLPREEGCERITVGRRGKGRRAVEACLSGSEH